jgi:NAD(P)-dependent dehydrogenase (short-subunit alcohol dehydrogenase family)
MEKKVIVLTGASGALGKHIAKYLENQGHFLVLQYNQNSIENSNPNVLTVACDLTNTISLKSLIDQAIARFGRIDVLINNAGISISNISWKTSAEENHSNQFECTVFLVASRDSKHAFQFFWTHHQYNISRCTNRICGHFRLHRIQSRIDRID